MVKKTGLALASTLVFGVILIMWCWTIVRCVDDLILAIGDEMHRVHEAGEK